MNSPEYCQNIYEAAKKVVKHYYNDEMLEKEDAERNLNGAIHSLERALEGKENV